MLNIYPVNYTSSVTLKQPTTAVCFHSAKELTDFQRHSLTCPRLHSLNVKLRIWGSISLATKSHSEGKEIKSMGHMLTFTVWILMKYIFYFENIPHENMDETEGHYLK